MLNNLHPMRVVCVCVCWPQTPQATGANGIVSMTASATKLLAAKDGVKALKQDLKDVYRQLATDVPADEKLAYLQAKYTEQVGTCQHGTATLSVS